MTSTASATGGRVDEGRGRAAILEAIERPAPAIVVCDARGRDGARRRRPPGDADVVPVAVRRQRA